MTNSSLLAWDFVGCSTESCVSWETPQAQANWEGWSPKLDVAPETTDSVSHLWSRPEGHLAQMRKNGLRGGSSIVSPSEMLVVGVLAQPLTCWGSRPSLNFPSSLSFYPLPFLPLLHPSLPLSFSFFFFIVIKHI